MVPGEGKHGEESGVQVAAVLVPLDALVGAHHVLHRCPFRRRYSPTDRTAVRRPERCQMRRISYIIRFFFIIVLAILRNLLKLDIFFFVFSCHLNANQLTFSYCDTLTSIPADNFYLKKSPNLPMLALELLEPRLSRKRLSCRHMLRLTKMALPGGQVKCRSPSKVPSLSPSLPSS